MDGDYDWRNYLDEEYENVPLHALRYSATRRIGMCLNQKQVMHHDIVPDFGGLAELVGFDGVEIQVSLKAVLRYIVYFRFFFLKSLHFGLENQIS